MLHFDAFDRYHHGDSKLHHLDPRVKVVVALAYILSNAMLPDGAWVSFGLAWLLLLAANLMAGLGAGFTLRRSFVAVPFVLAAVTAVFLPTGDALAELRVGGTQLVVTDAGLLRFGSIAVRSWLSVQAAVLLVTVTQFPDLIHAFEHLHVPKVIITVVAFLYRYMFVLTDEVLRLLRGRQARSAATPGRRAGGTPIWRARVAGGLIGQLFLRSYDRSERIYQAMLARGYSGSMRTLNPHALRAGDWAPVVAALTALAMVQWLGRL